VSEISLTFAAGVARMVPCFCHASGIDRQFAGGGRLCIPPAAFPCISRQDAPETFGGCQGRGAGFRRRSTYVKRQLSGVLKGVRSAVGAVFDGEAVCYV
jgi:hypothetical protein